MSNTSKIQARTNRYGYLFCAPFLIAFLFFSLWPIIYTFMLSFGDLKGLKTNFSFIGLANFTKLIHDKYFWGAVANTFILWGFNFAPQLGIALLFAILLTDVKLDIKGKGLFRALFYLPNLLTAKPHFRTDCLKLLSFLYPFFNVMCDVCVSNIIDKKKY